MPVSRNFRKNRAKNKRNKTNSSTKPLANKLTEPELALLAQPTNQVKMSEVIMDFALPLLERAEKIEHKKKVIALAILAWNASLLPKDEQIDSINQIIRGLSISGSEELKYLWQVLTTLIDRKRRFFSDNKRFILNYQISDLPTSFHLSVVSTLSPT